MARSVDAYRIGHDVDRGFGFRFKPRQICFGHGETSSVGICWESARHARKGDQRSSHTCYRVAFHDPVPARRQLDIGAAAGVTAIAYVSCCASGHGISSQLSFFII
jgi:hypothetical protein